MNHAALLRRKNTFVRSKIAYHPLLRASTPDVSFIDLSKSTQAIATEMMEYSKRSYENSTKAMENIFAVKSLDKAIEVQSECAKSMFEDFSARLPSSVNFTLN